MLSSLPPVECRKVGRGPTCGLRSLGFGHGLRTAILCTEGTEHGSPELYKTEFWAPCDVCVKGPLFLRKPGVGSFLKFPSIPDPCAQANEIWACVNELYSC